MELNEQHGFLEELLALRRDMTWESAMTNNPTPQLSELFSNNNTNEFGFDYNFFENNPSANNDNDNNNNNVIPNSPLFQTSLNTNNETYSCPFTSRDFSLELLPHELTNNNNFQVHEDLLYPQFMQEEEEEDEEEEEEFGIILGDSDQIIHNVDQTKLSCKIEPITTTQSSISSPEDIPSFNMGTTQANVNTGFGNKANKKLQGQPSKNLMAERRRRKRLNDRLSMLRSIVPKISKMDRTSILGDAIDYMKELLERIENLRREIEAGTGQSTAEIGLFKQVKPNEVLVRNSPKFDVDRRNMDTRIEICCAAKPGLLCSTVTTLEALGLEIQHCVISCFNDFAMQASCSEDLEKRTVIRPEEVKQALFRNAGYGGRCL